MSSVRTWNELMQVEQQEGRSQEEVDKTDLRVFFTPIQAQSSTSNPLRGTSSSMNTSNTSVPQTYDAQRESGLVLQRGTEATFQVSQSVSNEQLANSDT